MSNLYRKKLGKRGEEKACLLLEQKGFVVIFKNYFAGHLGEIDLIASKENTILFVEVKTRSNEAFGGSLYSITKKKLSSLRKSANYFLVNNPEYNNNRYNYRFDLICINGEDAEWLEDIVR